MTTIDTTEAARALCAAWPEPALTDNVFIYDGSGRVLVHVDPDYRLSDTEAVDLTLAIMALPAIRRRCAELVKQITGAQP